jgi:hypothetical protein
LKWCLVLVAVAAACLTNADAWAGTQCLAVNEVYTGAGGIGAPYNRNYVELVNRCGATIDLSGLFARTLDSGNAIRADVALSGSLGPGRHFLIGYGDPAPGPPLPAPDASYPLGGFSPGKVYVENGTVNPTLACPSGASIVDQLDYGANAVPCLEGSGEASSPTATQSIARTGCVDTDDDAADFSLATPTPENSSAPPDCSRPTAVAVRGFVALRTPYGVLVRWRSSQIGLLGFDVYRGAGSRRTRIGRAFVAPFAVRDRRAPRGTVRYWIRALWPDGTADWYGPVTSR